MRQTPETIKAHQRAKAMQRREHMDKLFLSDGPRLWEERFDRTANMPVWFLPSAVGGVIAGEDLLLHAGYRPGSHRPRDWCASGDGAFKRRISKRQVIYVRQNGH